MINVGTIFIYIFFYIPRFTTLAVLERLHVFVTVSSRDNSSNGNSTSVLRENSDSFYYIPFPKKHYYSSLIVYRGLIILAVGVFTSLVVVLAHWFWNGRDVSCSWTYLFCKQSHCRVLLPNRSRVCISGQPMEQEEASSAGYFDSSREAGWYVFH